MNTREMLAMTRQSSEMSNCSRRQQDLFPKIKPHQSDPHRLQNILRDVGLARKLRNDIRFADQKVRRDAAIVAYTHVLDRIFDNLIELENQIEPG